MVRTTVRCIGGSDAGFPRLQIDNCRDWRECYIGVLMRPPDKVALRLVGLGAHDTLPDAYPGECGLDRCLGNRNKSERSSRLRTNESVVCSRSFLLQRRRHSVTLVSLTNRLML